MESHSGYYSLIQFCPDASRLEALNVGIVILSPKQRLLKTRWASNAKTRLRRVFAAVPATFESERDSLEHRLTTAQPPTTEAELKHFADTRTGTLRITQPRFFKVTAIESDLKNLFERLVADLPAGKTEDTQQFTLAQEHEPYPANSTPS